MRSITEDDVRKAYRAAIRDECALPVADAIMAAAEDRLRCLKLTGIPNDGLAKTWGPDDGYRGQPLEVTRSTWPNDPKYEFGFSGFRPTSAENPALDRLLNEIRDYMVRLYATAHANFCEAEGGEQTTELMGSVALAELRLLEKLSNCAGLRSIRQDFEQIKHPTAVPPPVVVEGALTERCRSEVLNQAAAWFAKDPDITSIEIHSWSGHSARVSPIRPVGRSEG